MSLKLTLKLNFKLIFNYSYTNLKTKNYVRIMEATASYKAIGSTG